MQALLQNDWRQRAACSSSHAPPAHRPPLNFTLLSSPHAPADDCPPAPLHLRPALPCPALPATADVEYTMARSRYKFDDLEAYMAAAYSVRDRLIEEWNDTQ